MKNYILIILSVVLCACSGVKKTQEAANSGDYQTAINNAISSISENKNKKGNQAFIVLLEEVYKKNTLRELDRIDFLKREGRATNYEEIYTRYSNLKETQERIKSLLPLRRNDHNKNAVFLFKDYDNQLIASKKALTAYLYTNAVATLENSTSKNSYRATYDDLTYLQELQPNYKDVAKLQEQAYLNGLDYVMVKVLNSTNKIIPEALENDLLNLNTYNLNNLWTEYHTNKNPKIRYDYEMEVAFRNLEISPEQITEKQFVKEQQIKDGLKFVRDLNGDVVKDSLGNKIETDNFKTVQCTFYQFTQFKSVKIDGMVRFKNLESNQLINEYPLTSSFIFDHVYATYKGDKRALNDDLLLLSRVTRQPFPSDEQMVYDTGEDLKNTLKSILNRHHF